MNVKYKTLEKVVTEEIAKTVPSVLTIGGLDIEAPLPILTSKEYRYAVRCREAGVLASDVVFENPIYMSISIMGDPNPGQGGIVDMQRLGEEKFRSSLVASRRKDLEDISSTIKIWHPQLGKFWENLSLKQCRLLFAVGKEIGGNVVEFHVPLDEAPDAAVQRFLEWQVALGTTKVLCPIISSKLHPEAFRALVEAFMHMEGAPKMLMISGAALSERSVLTNYIYLESEVCNDVFVVATDLKERRRHKRDGECVQVHRGAHIVKTFGISAFSCDTNVPYENKPYTAVNARRLDITSPNLEYLCEDEYGSKDMDGCECPVCKGKTSEDFFSHRVQPSTFSAMTGLHTALNIPQRIRSLRDSVLE